MKTAIRCSIKTWRSFSTKASNVLKSKLPEIDLPSIPIHEHIFKNINKWQDKTALVCQQTSRSYKYHEVFNKSRAIAFFFKNKLKLQKGDTIAVIMPNVPEYPIIMLAASQAGLRVTTVNPLFNPEETSKQLVQSDTKAVVTLSLTYPSAVKAVTISKQALPIIVVRHEQHHSLSQGAIDFHEINNCKNVELEEADPSETFALPCSSGTTGLPKAVELTHNSIVANIIQTAVPAVKLHIDADGENQDVVPIFIPMFHIYGMVTAMLSMLAGGCKLVTLPKFGTQELLQTLEKYRPTVINVVPPVVNLINKNSDFTSKLLESIRIMSSGAAPLGASDVESFKEKTNGKVALVQGYGMTEASPVVCFQSSVLENGVKFGGIGLLISNTEGKVVAVDDPQGKALGPNESGELYVRGPQVMKGYYKNKAATKECITEDGFLKTGDIVHYDEDQHFFVTDRLKELIKVKGFQVAPAELEVILRQHPQIVDAAVAGVVHPLAGEVPKAYVVVKDRKLINASEIENFVGSKVTDYKKLVGGVAFVENIPRNASGKILRRELKNL